MNYFSKMKGASKSPPRVSGWEIFLSWLGSFLGIGFIALIDMEVNRGADMALIIAPFGASAVLLYGATKSPLAQPRNVLGGHILSALVGVAAFKVCQGQVWLAAPLAVSTAIAVMHATKTLHPPGGATALIAVIGSEKTHALGFLFAILPVGAGAAALLLVALVFNNLSRSRRYPEYWF
ncbi:MAG: HPP family protein [Desulfomonilaceae bacterium]